MAGGTILTTADVNELIDQVQRTRRTKLVMAVMLGALAWTVVVGGLSHYNKRRAYRLSVASMALVEQNKVLEARAEAAERRYNDLKKAMAVSMDATKLGRPVRLSGEMIVVFAGEVK